MLTLQTFCLMAVATDESSYVLGHDLLVDGGLSNAYVVSTPNSLASLSQTAIHLVSKWSN